MLPTRDKVKVKEYLTLKWGSLKSCNITSKIGKKLLGEYHKKGSCISAVMQHDTLEQKKIICRLIDLMPGKIYLEWDGKYVSKGKAKKYVLEYGRSPNESTYKRRS